jgi:hypothetical protein
MRRGNGISYGMLTSFIIHNKRFGTEVGGFIQSFSIRGVIGSRAQRNFQLRTLWVVTLCSLAGRR